VPEYQIEIIDNPLPEHINVIEEGLSASIPEGVESRNFQPLVILLRDVDEKIVGGLQGHTYWGWLSIKLLWISEDLRDLGHGKKLVEAAEECALTRGCHASVVDTYSFQSQEFYKKLGYETFGTLEDFPKGHKRFYMRKHLEYSCRG